MRALLSMRQETSAEPLTAEGERGWLDLGDHSVTATFSLAFSTFLVTVLKSL